MNAGATRFWSPERAVDLLAILLSDVRYGLGAYLGVYLMTEHGWDPASIGYALSFGGIVGLIAQAPLGCVVGAGALMFGGRRGMVIIGASLGTLIFLGSVKGIVA